MTERPARSWPLWLLVAVAAVAAVAVGWAVGPHLGTQTKLFPMAALGLAGVTALAVGVTMLEPAWILSAGLALSIFSGNWANLHVPGPLDRVVVVVGIAAVLLRPLFVADAPRVELRRVHWLLALLVLYAFGSAAWSNTLSQHNALFELLDRLGIVPFLLYLVAPAAFGTDAQRRVLLVVLAVIGGYLGVTALFEMVGPHQLVFPSYINNQALGLHQGRARGPFLEAGADGLAMFTGIVAATMLLGQVARRWVKVVLGAVIGVCLLGIVLTLTRQVWAGAAVGALLAALISPNLRRHVLVAAPILAIGVVASVLLIPGLRSEVSSRASTQNSLWDRYNSDAAALRMVESRPLLGFGWGEFINDSSRYYHVAKTYPLSSVPEVHNVLLSNAAELGAVGVVIWLAALGIAMISPLLRRGPPELEPWKLGLVAVAVAWFVQANFAPLSYAFDNYVPWLFAGVAYGSSRVRSRPAAPASIRGRSAERSGHAPVAGRLAEQPVA